MENENERGTEPTADSSYLLMDLNDVFIRMYVQKKLNLLQHSLPFIGNTLEQRRRLRLIQTLYASKAALEAQQGDEDLAFVDRGVQAIIDGDWEETCAIAQMCDEPPYRVFREVLEQAKAQALPSDPFTLTVTRGGAWGRGKTKG